MSVPVMDASRKVKLCPAAAASYDIVPPSISFDPAPLKVSLPFTFNVEPPSTLSLPIGPKAVSETL